jgi:pilus assembly protein CpaB
VPGDRVDVFVTHSGQDDELPRADLLVQGARVLAIGQRSDAGETKPQVSKSLTVEVTAVQAQKIALAQSVGTLSVALRNLVDESRVQLATTQLVDLTDGMPSRILRKVERRTADPAPAAADRPTGPIVPPGPKVEVFRGGKTGTSNVVYGVPKG